MQNPQVQGFAGNNLDDLHVQGWPEFGQVAGNST